MKRKKDAERGSLSRRDFLKISGITAGALTVGSWGDLRPSIARDIYPAEKIVWIIPNNAGGGYDTFVRSISPYVSKYLKELSPGARGGNIQVKNEGASAGRKGYKDMFNAKPDGYTIGIMSTGLITDGIVEKPEFDLSKFTYLALGSSATNVIVASKKGFNSWDEVVNEMNKKPVKLTVGSFGRGNHVSALIMHEKMGTNFKIINFPGSGSLNALLRGDVPLALVTEDSAEALLDAKELKVLLVFGETSDYPGAVTIKELGFPELATQIGVHRFIVAPPNLEAEPKNLLISAFQKAMSDEQFVAWAKKAKSRLGNLYGGDAEKMLLQMKKFYEDLAPVLKKNLQ